MTVVLEPGECLYRAGERPDVGFVVLSGLLRQAMLLADGRRQVLQFVFPHDVLDGADAAVLPLSAEAVEHAEVRCFPKALLERLLSRDAAARADWQRMGERHVLEMQRRQIVLGRLSSTERLAYFLTWLAQHVPAAPEGGMRMPMARGDIADYLGLSVETVSRTFAALRDMGLIDLESMRHVRIKNAGALRALAADLLPTSGLAQPHASPATGTYSLAS